MSNERKPDGKEPSAEESACETPAPTAPEERIRALEEELRAKEEEARANRDKYLREVADGDNLRKRLQREKSEAIRYATENLVVDLLPVIDNLELAISHASAGGNGKSVVEGLEMVVRLFRDTLERNGVTTIEAAKGTPADWNIHEASGMEERSDLPPNVVISTEQKGYRLHERVVRPARVIVARPPREEGETPAE